MDLSTDLNATAAQRVTEALQMAGWFGAELQAAAPSARHRKEVGTGGYDEQTYVKNRTLSPFDV